VKITRLNGPSSRQTAKLSWLRNVQDEPVADNGNSRICNPLRDSVKASTRGLWNERARSTSSNMDALSTSSHERDLVGFACPPRPQGSQYRCRSPDDQVDVLIEVDRAARQLGAPTVVEGLPGGKAIAAGDRERGRASTTWYRRGGGDSRRLARQGGQGVSLGSPFLPPAWLSSRRRP